MALDNAVDTLSATLHERYGESLESSLRAAVGESKAQLFSMMRYHLGWENEYGKQSEGPRPRRLLGMACLLACEALGGDFQRALPVATAVELAYNFSLVHEDIRDGTPDRRERTTVWWLWGPSQAINTGDALYALARIAMLKLAEAGLPHDRVLRAAQVLDEACLKLCEGQYLDLSFQGQLEVKLASYMKMAEGKSASLPPCALKLGALAATDDPKALEALGTVGERVGLATQARQDLLDLWGPKKEHELRGAALRNRGKSLPLAYGFDKSAAKQKMDLVGFFQKQHLKDGDVDRLAALLEQLGAREYTLGLLDAYRAEALGALRTLPLRTPAGERLEQIVTALTERPHLV